MTDDNSNLVDISLDDFSKTFFGTDEPAIADPPKVEETQEEPEGEETEDDALATEQTDTDEPEGEEPEGEEEEEPEEKPAKPTKKSAQDRINEVVAKQREAERERDTLLRRVAELEASTKKPENTTPDPTPLRETLSADAPSPDALNEDGSPKYRLGEFDPMYIRDLTKHTIEQETKANKEAQAQEEQRKMVEAAQEELRSSWLEKLDATAEEIPDIRDKIGNVEAAFTGIDPSYGEFLAATIMSCEHGPEIMYYFSQNIGEAQKIVASGPAAATLALGRLDAKFTKASAPEEKRNKKTSSAPNPPPTQNRGSGGKFSTPGDTTDLSAFEREFYNKK